MLMWTLQHSALFKWCPAPLRRAGSCFSSRVKEFLRAREGGGSVSHVTYRLDAQEGRESERETDRREQSVNVAGLTAHLLQDSGIYNSTRFTNSTRFITPERQQPIRGKVCTRDQLETSCTASLFIILTSGLFFSFRVFLFCCCCCLLTREDERVPPGWWRVASARDHHPLHEDLEVQVLRR